MPTVLDDVLKKKKNKKKSEIPIIGPNGEPCRKWRRKKKNL